MIKITVTVEGMHCPKCAAKAEAAISDKYAVKSVKASHTENKVEILTELAIDDEAITAAIAAIGFTATAITREEVKKKGFFARLFRK